MVEPEFALNIGYIARTMANFGLTRLVVVSNRRLGKLQINSAKVFASHGKGIVENIKYARSMGALRRKFRLLIGTTAIVGTRKANLTRRTMDVESCAMRLSKRISLQPRATCIVLGRDTTGMTNEELRCCDYNLTVRASERYNTLNVSHAIAITLYVFSKFLKKTEVRPNVTISSRKERERVISLFEELAMLSDFQKFKSMLLRETMSRLLDRADPSLRETYLLMGLASKAASKIRRQSIQSPLRTHPSELSSSSKMEL